ncbi:hypothetical protein AC579_1152 [Pseudocercospora musae]|uniref:Uncharacterized protein n=1 Tax=Pseudocercospora musae TaxID=113226 RepID=A0A139H3W2_9PEZI|nr:hypothetical protein AC579_1152 [Pseudocercospora musae]
MPTMQEAIAFSVGEAIGIAVGALSAALLPNRKHHPPIDQPPAPMPVTVLEYIHPSRTVQALQCLILVAVTGLSTYLLLVSFYRNKYGIPAPHEAVAAVTAMYLTAAVVAAKKMMRGWALRLATKLEDSGDEERESSEGAKGGGIGEDIEGYVQVGRG